MVLRGRIEPCLRYNLLLAAARGLTARRGGRAAAQAPCACERSRYMAFSQACQCFTSRGTAREERRAVVSGRTLRIPRPAAVRVHAAQAGGHGGRAVAVGQEQRGARTRVPPLREQQTLIHGAR